MIPIMQYCFTLIAFHQQQPRSITRHVLRFAPQVHNDCSIPEVGVTTTRGSEALSGRKFMAYVSREEEYSRRLLLESPAVYSVYEARL